MGGKEKFFTTLKDREQGGTETGCEEPKLWILDKFFLSFFLSTQLKLLVFKKQLKSNGGIKLLAWQ